MNKKRKIILIVSGTLFLLLISLIGTFFLLTSSVNKNEITQEFIVESGESYASLSNNLKEAGLIRNEFVYKIYVKILKPNALEAGVYVLSPSMNLKEILNVLKEGASDKRQTINVTFVEGKNMRYIINKIVENFSITEEEIMELLNNDEYLSELIEKYWIMTDEIKNKNLYFSLEGYLFPDTYQFYVDASIKEIFEKMLNNLQSKLSNYKQEIENSGYSFHEMLTLASIVEQESRKESDRKGVAGVFYNRLESNWSLGSDVTTYYAEKLELWSRDLYTSEINSCNDYNTRASCMAGKLPIGPICNPSLEAVIASIEPTKHKYYYFVSDVYGVIYFNETLQQHNITTARLKDEGKWFEYD